MSDKLYDAKALINAMEGRAKEYESLHKQLAAIRKEFDLIVKMDDELKGKGAEAIKGFYQAQIDTVDAWTGLVDRHIAFFKGISGDAEEAELGEGTIIVVPFLESEVALADQKSKDLVSAQKRDLKVILDRIHDIIDLKPFSDDDFQDEIQEAERKRTKTIAKVNKLDSKWLTEYAESEDDQASITALMKQLSESSTRGGKVSPLYFNAKSYKSSEVYKDLQEQRKEDEAYLKVKKKEAEERRHRDLNANLARQVSNPREYLKAADKIGFTNLHPDQRTLYMKYMEEDLKRGATIGLLDAGKDFAKDIFNFVMDPEAAEMAVYESVIHYKQTYQIMKKAIVDSYEKNMVHGDWYSRAHWVTYAIGSAFANVAGTKGMGAAAKTGMATARIATKNVVSKAGKLAQIPSKTPLEYSLAVDGQVPYNAINSKGLKDRLSAFSDEGKVGKGKGNVLDDGTVWGNIKITQPFYNSTKIPKSFELAVDGEKFWVHPNGTKHMVEYITRDATTHGMPVNSQTLLSSFESSVKKAVNEGLKYEEIMNVGNWELIFSKPRRDGLLPVIKHAVYRP